MGIIVRLAWGNLCFQDQIGRLFSSSLFPSLLSCTPAERWLNFSLPEIYSWQSCQEGTGNVELCQSHCLQGSVFHYPDLCLAQLSLPTELWGCHSSSLNLTKVFVTLWWKIFSQERHYVVIWLWWFCSWCIRNGIILKHFPSLINWGALPKMFFNDLLYPEVEAASWSKDSFTWSSCSSWSSSFCSRGWDWPSLSESESSSERRALFNADGCSLGSFLLRCSEVVIRLHFVGVRCGQGSLLLVREGVEEEAVEVKGIYCGIPEGGIMVVASWSGSCNKVMKFVTATVLKNIHSYYSLNDIHNLLHFS